MDIDDDGTDPNAWSKANPSLGVAVKVDDLKRQIDEAREMPAQQNAMRRLRLDKWTEQVTRWLDMEVWAGAGPPATAGGTEIGDEVHRLERLLAGRECFGGLDLAGVSDPSAFLLLFTPTRDTALGELADKWTVLSRFWVPQEDIERRARCDWVVSVTKGS